MVLAQIPRLGGIICALLGLNMKSSSSTGQGFTKEWSLGCMIPVSWSPLVAGALSTQPRDHSIADPCTIVSNFATRSNKPMQKSVERAERWPFLLPLKWIDLFSQSCSSSAKLRFITVTLPSTSLLG